MLVIKDLEIKNIYILDLEYELKALDSILLKVKNNPEGLYLSHLRLPLTHEEHGLFIHPSNTRLDLNNIPNSLDVNIVDKNEKLLVSGYNLFYNKDTISNKPFLSILSIDFLNALVDFLQFYNNKNKNLYFVNELCEDSEYLLDGSIKTFVYIEDVVLFYFKNLNVNDINIVMDIVNNKIVPTINDILMIDTNAYYRINYVGQDIFINKYNDLRTIRYEEAVDITNFNYMLNKNYEENV